MSVENLEKNKGDDEPILNAPERGDQNITKNIEQGGATTVGGASTTGDEDDDKKTSKKEFERLEKDEEEKDKKELASAREKLDLSPEQKNDTEKFDPEKIRKQITERLSEIFVGTTEEDNLYDEADNLKEVIKESDEIFAQATQEGWSNERIAQELSKIRVEINTNRYKGTEGFAPGHIGAEHLHLLGEFVDGMPVDEEELEKMRKKEKDEEKQLNESSKQRAADQERAVREEKKRKLGEAFAEAARIKKIQDDAERRHQEDRVREAREAEERRKAEEENRRSNSLGGRIRRFFGGK